MSLTMHGGGSCFVWGRLLVEGSWAFRAKRRQIAGPHTLDPTATAREHQHNSKDQHNCGAYLRLMHCTQAPVPDLDLV